ncbi:MAG TPA: hypothetical protein VKS21_02035 [Spirochaetota bacterium]|nr:hypothetical protein [Spirochaetota bacterium]
MSYLQKIILSLLLYSFAAAQEGDNTNVSEPAADADDLFAEMQIEKKSAAGSNTARCLELNGKHKFLLRIPFLEGKTALDGKMKAPGFRNSLGFNYNKNNITVISELQFDFFMHKGGDWDELTDFKVLENAIYRNADKLTIGAGYQFYTWGSADEQNPTDNLNPLDYSLGPDAEKIPLLSVSLNYFPSRKINIETVLAPYSQAALLPLDIAEEIPEAVFNKNLISSVYTNPANTNLLGLPKTWSVAAEDKQVTTRAPAYKLHSGLAGARISFFTKAADFSVSYLYDLDPFYTPVITLQRYLAADLSNIDFPFSNNYTNAYSYRVQKIALKRKRVHRLGCDLRFSAGPLGLWAEACYSITEDLKLDNYKIRNHDLSWTAGFDTDLGNRDQHYLNFQYYGRFIPAYYHSFYKDYPEGQPQPEKSGDKKYMEKYYYRMFTDRAALYTEGLLQAIAVYLDLSFKNGKYQPHLALSYQLPRQYDQQAGTRYGGLFLNPEVNIAPADSFHILLGANYYRSFYKEKGSSKIKNNEQTQMGLFNKDSAAYIKFTYEWFSK